MTIDLPCQRSWLGEKNVFVEPLWRVPPTQLNVFAKIVIFPEDQKTTNKQKKSIEEGAAPPFLVSYDLEAVCVNLITNTLQP